MWDEENRIRAIMDNGATYHYIYDASGERVLKGHSSGQAAFVNREHKAGSASMSNYTVYVNPYLVLKSGGYTKHYYIEGQRIVSKLGGGWDNNGKGPLKAGGDKVNYANKEQQIIEGIVKNLKFLGLDGQILTAGKSGKVPPGQLKGNAAGGGNGGGGSTSTAETFQYFYHPDHLGSTSYVTDASGEVYQHVEYFAFGETFVEEHSNTDRTPYLFNGKELDEETGLYYYGARYYDARTSIWASVDPLAEHPNQADKSPYAFTWNNPTNLVDPDGLCPECEENVLDPKEGQVYTSTGGANYTYGNDSWTREGGSMEEVVITAPRLPTNNDGNNNTQNKSSNTTNNSPNSNSTELTATPWMTTALNEYNAGVKEAPKGSNSGPKVDVYLKYAGASSPNAWCASYVHWCLRQNGIKGAGAKGSNYLNWGTKLQTPTYGAIAVLQQIMLDFIWVKMPMEH